MNDGDADNLDVFEWELYTKLLNNQSTALNRLTQEAEHLREENRLLRKTNEDLKRQLIARLLIGGGIPGGQYAGGMESPTSVIDERSTPPPPPTRQDTHNNNNHLPKSISVRSNGYRSHTNNTNEIKADKYDALGFVNTSPPTANISQQNGSTYPQQQQRLYMQKIDDDEAARIMELQAYTQGTYKTELCNKWQETGVCPYDSYCRFAHGVSELRPVLRHPRYKTQLCRMVQNGRSCPYGHRCHFRHSLTS